MSGGDLALLKAQEKAEDDVNISIKDLKNAIFRMPNVKHVVYFGITCGMSAPYVGSQIQWILDNEKQSDLKFTTILIGFNPIEASRKTKIENYDKTMYDIVKSLNSLVGDGRHFILNPIIGPESITGSSRMKGGTTTKILIETIFGKLFSDSFNLPTIDGMRNSNISVTEIFSAFEESYRHTYFHIDEMSKVINLAGEALRKGKRISYIACNTISLLGLIDASECTPTFGAAFNDFRGFIVGGWDTIKNMDGDISHFGSDYEISDDYFLNNYLTQLGSDDLLIFLYSKLYPHDQQIEVLNKIRKVNNNIKLVVIVWKKVDESRPELSKHISPNDLEIHVSIPFNNLIEGSSSLLELSVKLVLNAISTGAHIKKGKVWKNRMIDLSLSNNKLYYRGIDLVAKLMSVSKEESETNILRVIYHGISQDIDSIRKYPISDHISNAMIKKSVIPTALLLSSGQFNSVDDAIEAVKKEPILRNAISLAIEKKKFQSC